MEAQEQASGQAGGGQMGQLVMNVGKGLSMIASVLDRAEGAPDELKAEMADIMARFQGVVEAMSGQAQEQEQEEPEEQAPQQPRSKAVPMQSQAGRPVGPGGV